MGHHHPTPPHHPQLLSMKEGSHNKPQRVGKGQSGPPHLSSQKNSGRTARGRTWSSPPCSVRTSSILLVALFELTLTFKKRASNLVTAPNAVNISAYRQIWQDGNTWKSRLLKKPSISASISRSAASFASFSPVICWHLTKLNRTKARRRLNILISIWWWWMMLKFFPNRLPYSGSRSFTTFTKQGRICFAGKVRTLQPVPCPLA